MKNAKKNAPFENWSLEMKYYKTPTMTQKSQNTKKMNAMSWYNSFSSQSHFHKCLNFYKMESQQLLKNLVSLRCKATKTSKLLQDGIPTILRNLVNLGCRATKT
jgi:hypothetical protein